MRGSGRSKAALAAVLGSMAVQAFAAGPSGWTLDVADSSMVDNPARCGQCVRASPEVVKLILASTGIAPRGEEKALRLEGDELRFTSNINFRARLDGREYPVEGLPFADAVAIQMRDDGDVATTVKAGGKPVSTYRRTMVSDNRMVITVRHVGLRGAESREILVFRREP
jgi:hypothetical protein